MNSQTFGNQQQKQQYKAPQQQNFNAYQQQQMNQQQRFVNYQQIPQMNHVVKAYEPAIFNDDEVIEEFKDEVKNPNKKTTYDLEKGLEIDIRSTQKQVKISSQIDTILPCMISLRTKNSTNDQIKDALSDRTPIDLICVIDHSGSMSGPKIEQVRKTLELFLEILSEKDRLCLIQFDNNAQRLTPLLKVAPYNKQNFTNIIKGIHDDGGTNIQLGMSKAFQVIKQRKYKNPVTSIFLLSDGLDGKAQDRVKQSLEQFKIEDNFTINTFGYGADHDPQLMNDISKLQDGNFYYIENIDQVDEAFVNALGGLISVIGQDIRLIVDVVRNKPFTDIKIQKTFGEMWKKQNDTSYVITLNQIISGVSKDFMLEVRLPPMNDTLDDSERNQVILKAIVEVKQVGGEQQKIVKKEKFSNITFYNQNENIGEIEEDGEVLANYFRVKGAEAMAEGMKYAEQGQFEQGQQVIQNIIQNISQNKYVNPQQVNGIMQDLQSANQVCQPKIYQEKGKHQIISMNRAHMEQRSQMVQQNYSYSNQAQQMLVKNVQMSKKK